MYLVENPKIFDIFYVMVGTIIKPKSPVKVHEGKQTFILSKL